MSAATEAGCSLSTCIDPTEWPRKRRKGREDSVFMCSQTTYLRRDTILQSRKRSLRHAVVPLAASPPLPQSRVQWYSIKLFVDLHHNSNAFASPPACWLHTVQCSNYSLITSSLQMVTMTVRVGIKVSLTHSVCISVQWSLQLWTYLYNWKVYLFRLFFFSHCSCWLFTSIANNSRTYRSEHQSIRGNHLQMNPPIAFIIEWLAVSWKKRKLSKLVSLLAH